MNTGLTQNRHGVVATPGLTFVRSAASRLAMTALRKSWNRNPTGTMTAQQTWVGRSLALVVLATAVGPALAHDTWFERVDNPQGSAGQALQLALGTGNQYPLYEVPVEPKVVSHLTCTDAQGAVHQPESVRVGRRHTLLRVPGPEVGTFSCVARLQSFEVELAPAIVDLYFDDIRADDTLRAVLVRQRAQGRPFEERYLKIARIEGVAAPVRHKNQPLDVLRVTPSGVLQAGADAVFEVQRDGQPLAALPVQLLHETTPGGIWAYTDAAGRVRFRLPQPGRWLLRGVDLRPPKTEDARWESRFIAYTFEVAR